MASGFVTVADLPFAVHSAALDVFVGSPSPAFPSSCSTVLKWGFSIRAHRLMEPHAEWEPHVSAEVLFATDPGSLAQWQDIAPRSIQWSSRANADNDLHASMYLYEHAPVLDAEVTLERKGQGVSLRLSGTTDIGWEAPYGRGLRLEVQATFDKLTVLAGRDTELDAREALQPHLDDTQFGFFRDEYGVSTLRSR